MNILIQHIEKLLPDHDCVVVPGLGGFVQNEIPARFDTDADVFYPRGKGVCFNAKLTFNDGFLAQSYQETYDIGFEEANMEIRRGVQEIKDKLEHGKYVSLGRVGVIWISDFGQLQFRPESKNLFLPDSYGLTSFTFPSLERRNKKSLTADSYNHRHSSPKPEYSRRKHHTEQHHKLEPSFQEFKRFNKSEEEFINFRLPKRSFRNFLTGAAAFLIMLFISKPTGSLSNANQQEAFMMHDYLTASIPAAQLPDSTTTYSEENDLSQKAAIRDVVTTSPTETIPTVRTTFVTTKPDTATTRAHQVKTPHRLYYIVISSFPQKKLAEAWIRANRHCDRFRFSGIVQKDGRSRVFARSFPEKKDAEAFLRQFRATNPDYASAWLYSEKN